MGGSEELTSIIKLSILKPTAAANTCSEVFILTPFFSKFVPRSVFVTNLAFASITGVPSKSTRTKA